jgi:hypothetical protein
MEGNITYRIHQRTTHNCVTVSLGTTEIPFWHPRGEFTASSKVKDLRQRGIEVTVETVDTSGNQVPNNL